MAPTHHTFAAIPELDRGYRRRLLDGLAQSIRTKGLRETQIGDIVAIARTSRRTFYECFPDKEACFAELIDEWSQSLLDRVRGSVDPHASWEQQVDATVDAYLDALREDPVLAVTVSRELPALGARGIELQEEDVDRYVELLVELSRGPAMRAAGIEPVSRGTAVMLIGGFAEVLDRAIRDGREPDAIGGAVKRVIKRVLGP